MKLMEQLRQELRSNYFSLATEEAYVDWCERFVRFHNVKHPSEMGPLEVEQFLSHLAVECQVPAYAQNQAICSILFLYRHVLDLPLHEVEATRTQQPARLPVVLSKSEMRSLLNNIEGNYRLVCRVLYGCGLRFRECLRLRVKDLDFDRNTVFVRAGKGEKDRVVMMPSSLKPRLLQHVGQRLAIHKDDLQGGYGQVQLPYEFINQDHNAERSLEWQYLFASTQLSCEPQSDPPTMRRHHLHPTAITRALKVAARSCGISKRVSANMLRHSFAIHLLEAGTDIRTLQQLLGHRDLITTMVYTHLTKQGSPEVVSPLDQLESNTEMVRELTARDGVQVCRDTSERPYELVA